MHKIRNTSKRTKHLGLITKKLPKIFTIVILCLILESSQANVQEKTQIVFQKPFKGDQKVTKNENSIFQTLNKNFDNSNDSNSTPQKNSETNDILMIKNGDFCENSTNCKSGCCQYSTCLDMTFCDLNTLPSDQSISTKQLGSVGSSCTNDDVCETSCCIDSTCASQTNCYIGGQFQDFCLNDSQCDSENYGCCFGFQCLSSNKCAGLLDIGQHCVQNSTCSSGICQNSQCIQAEKNGDGARCPSKVSGEPLCESGCCHEGVCVERQYCNSRFMSGRRLEIGSECATDPDCISYNCVALADQVSTGICLSYQQSALLDKGIEPIEAECYSNRTCATGCCYENKCSLQTFCGDLKGFSAQCDWDLQCDTGCCLQGTCQSTNLCSTNDTLDGSAGTACSQNSTCQSGCCNSETRLCENESSFATNFCNDKKGLGALCFQNDTCDTSCCFANQCSNEVMCAVESDTGASCSYFTSCKSGCCNGNQCVEPSVCGALELDLLSACSTNGQPCISGCCKEGICEDATFCGVTAFENDSCLFNQTCSTGCCIDNRCTETEKCDFESEKGQIESGNVCLENADCESGCCVGFTCALSQQICLGQEFNTTCSNNLQCTSGNCTERICQESKPVDGGLIVTSKGLGAYCGDENALECQSGCCFGNQCSEAQMCSNLKQNGQSCSTQAEIVNGTSQCMSGCCNPDNSLCASQAYCMETGGLYAILQPCTSDSQCLSGCCRGGICSKPGLNWSSLTPQIQQPMICTDRNFTDLQFENVQNGDPCQTSNQCETGCCLNAICSPQSSCGYQASSQPCFTNNQCQTGFCDQTTFVCQNNPSGYNKRAKGAYCGGKDSVCETDCCLGNTCVSATHCNLPEQINQMSCDTNSDCLSDCCSNFVCQDQTQCIEKGQVAVGGNEGDQCQNAQMCASGCCLEIFDPDSQNSFDPPQYQCQSAQFCSLLGNQGDSCVLGQQNDGCSDGLCCFQGVCSMADQHCSLAQFGENCSQNSTCVSGCCSLITGTCTDLVECGSGMGLNAHCTSSSPCASGCCYQNACAPLEFCNGQGNLLEKCGGDGSTCVSGCCYEEQCAPLSFCYQWNVFQKTCYQDQSCLNGCCNEHNQCLTSSVEQCNQSATFPSQIGQFCAQNQDCTTNCCTFGTCSSSERCGEYRSSQGQPEGAPCSNGQECQSGVCKDATYCVEKPGLKQDMLTSCQTDSDCTTECCFNGICSYELACYSEETKQTILEGYAGQSCQENQECLSGCCLSNLCFPNNTPCGTGMSIGAQCHTDSECQTGCCNQFYCLPPEMCLLNSSSLQQNDQPLQKNGQTCTEQSDCTSGCCIGNLCAANSYCTEKMPDGFLCTANFQCASQYCSQVDFVCTSYPVDSTTSITTSLIAPFQSSRRHQKDKQSEKSASIEQSSSSSGAFCQTNTDCKSECCQDNTCLDSVQYCQGSKVFGEECSMNVECANSCCFNNTCAWEGSCYGVSPGDQCSLTSENSTHTQCEYDMCCQSQSIQQPIDPISATNSTFCLETLQCPMEAYYWCERSSDCDSGCCIGAVCVESEQCQLGGQFQSPANYSDQCASGCTVVNDNNLEQKVCGTVQMCEQGSLGSLCSTSQMCQSGCCINHLCSPYEFYCQEEQESSSFGTPFSKSIPKPQLQSDYIEKNDSFTQLGQKCENTLDCAETKCCYNGFCAMSQFCGLTKAGQECTLNANCQSGSCSIDNLCAESSSDGFQSGSICFENDQCQSECCVQGICSEIGSTLCTDQLQEYSSCFLDQQCESGSCVNQKCQSASDFGTLPLNTACNADTQCSVGLCCGPDQKCTQLYNCPLHVGAPCTDSCCCIDNVCQADSFCTKLANGSKCLGRSNCLSDCCSKDLICEETCPSDNFAYPCSFDFECDTNCCYQNSATTTSALSTNNNSYLQQLVQPACNQIQKCTGGSLGGQCFKNSDCLSGCCSEDNGSICSEQTVCQEDDKKGDKSGSQWALILFVYILLPLVLLIVIGYFLYDKYYLARQRSYRRVLYSSVSGFEERETNIMQENGEEMQIDQRNQNNGDIDNVDVNPIDVDERDIDDYDRTNQGKPLNFSVQN